MIVNEIKDPVSTLRDMAAQHGFTCVDWLTHPRTGLASPQFNEFMETACIDHARLAARYYLASVELAQKHYEDSLCDICGVTPCVTSSELKRHTCTQCFIDDEGGTR